MRKIKFDKARKQLKVEGLKKPIKATTLDNFVGNANEFDKHRSDYIKYKSYFFVINNPESEDDYEIHNDITLQYQDTDLQKRLFAMKSAQEIEEINLIKEDYGY